MLYKLLDLNAKFMFCEHILSYRNWSSRFCEIFSGDSCDSTYSGRPQLDMEFCKMSCRDSCYSTCS